MSWEYFWEGISVEKSSMSSLCDELKKNKYDRREYTLNIRLPVNVV